MLEKSSFDHTNFSSLKEQYRHAQKALYEIEQAGTLKSKAKLNKRIGALYFWAREDKVNGDVWDLIRSELRRIGEENDIDLISMINGFEKETVQPIESNDPTEILEKVGSINWMGEDEV